MDKERVQDSFRAKKAGVFLCTLLFVFHMAPLRAQCAMCRAVLESGGETATAEGINNGIVYLMAVPYILVAVVFYFVFKKMRSKSP